MAKAQPFRLEATYTPISKRSCSRSLKKRDNLNWYTRNTSGYLSSSL
ncbi:flavodoxin [Lacticaseibacillus zeae]|uniref:Flavodoxin n=1 Tax=Lacticaseibacillus zeae TaxID=57037 RepID=A0A5R8LUL4_LACZE|nr:flavodoxin [Lacticaseibacillus zeae]